MVGRAYKLTRNMLSWISVNALTSFTNDFNSIYFELCSQTIIPLNNYTSTFLFLLFIFKDDSKTGAESLSHVKVRSVMMRGPLQKIQSRSAADILSSPRV